MNILMHQIGYDLFMRLGMDLRRDPKAAKPQERNMEPVVEKVDEKKDPKHGIAVEVIYNGLSKKIEISREATVKDLLDRAIAAFGSLPQPHLLALWNDKGAELTDEQQTLKDAKVKDRDELLLRPSAVKGG